MALANRQLIARPGGPRLAYRLGLIIWARRIFYRKPHVIAKTNKAERMSCRYHITLQVSVIRANLHFPSCL